MFKIIAHHFCLIFIANINDFDVAGLLVSIFVRKASELHQNAKGHRWSQQKVFIFSMLLIQNSESDEKAVDVDHNAKGHR